MKHLNLSRSVLIISAALAATELSRGILNPFVYDLFSACFEGTLSATSATCEYGRPTLTILIGSLIFFVILFVLGFKAAKLIKPTASAAMAVAYIVLMLGAYRLTISLSDNFAQLRNPESFTEYLFLTYVSVSTLFVGIAMSLFYRMGTGINTAHIPASARNEPRQKFKK